VTPVARPTAFAKARKRPWSAWGLGTAAALLAPGAFAEPLDEALYARALSRHPREVSDTARTRVDYRGLAHSEDWKRPAGATAPGRASGISTTTGV
jgi:hypothetical protein